MRDLMRAGASAFLLVAMMFLASLVLWIGIPAGWLYVGSQVQGATGSLGTALAVIAVGVLVSIGVVIALLSWLSRVHAHVREARGLEPAAGVALEGIMAVSAVVAVMGFGVWFLFFAGSSPLPIQGQ